MEQKYLGPPVGLWTGDLTRWVLTQLPAALSLLVGEAVRTNTSMVTFSEGHQIATARWVRKQSCTWSELGSQKSQCVPEWARWHCCPMSVRQLQGASCLGPLCCAVCSGIVFIQTPPKDTEMRQTWGYSALVKRYSCVSDKETGIEEDKGTISPPCKCYSWGKEAGKRGRKACKVRRAF